MRVSCLVNNYDYARYVADAVRSALGQTRPFDEVIVVDDGSTDDSLAVLAPLARDESRLTVVPQANGGQLSAFNTGLAHATGDVVCFLDADDLYEPGYAERLVALYQNRPDADFAFCTPQRFGDIDVREEPVVPDRDLGYSTAATLLGAASIGAPTSCLSMRRWVADAILPSPHTEAWRLCADAVLVYGSSLVGARKHHIGEPLVRYRLHGANGFAGRREDAAARYRRHMRVARLITLEAERLGLATARVAPLLPSEFRTIARPSARELRQWLKIVGRTGLPLASRLTMRLRMLQHYASTRAARPDGGVAAPAAPTPVEHAPTQGRAA